jgi:hypothetical protein
MKTRRLPALALALAALTLTACRLPGGAGQLDVAARPADPAPVPVAAAAAPSAQPTPMAAPGSPGPFSSTPPAAPIAAGGSGGSGGTGPAATTFLVGPDGQRVAVTPGDTVPLPAGMSGLVTLFAPGRVPATVRLPSGGLPALHPQAVAAEAPPAGTATVTGTVSPPVAGVSVLYVSRGRAGFVGTTTGADGTFSLAVPLDGSEPGVVVARDAADVPQLSFARVTAVSGASTAAPPLTLTAAGASAAPAPTPPAGLTLSQSALMAVEDAMGTPWAVPLTITNEAPILAPATYALGDAALSVVYAAEAADGLSGAEAAAPPYESAAFLAVPDLGRLAAPLEAGQTLSWSSVAGATLYTARLTAVGQVAPVWEGASDIPSLALPAGLDLPDATLILQVDAWNAPDVSVYTVAQVRALRVPSGLGGPRGQHSWARRVLGPAAKPAAPVL